MYFAGFLKSVLGKLLASVSWRWYLNVLWWGDCRWLQLRLYSPMTYECPPRTFGSAFANFGKPCYMSHTPTTHVLRRPTMLL